MLGKTNATTGGSSGGAGDTVTAINKTGAVINEGDKVWLQKDAQVGDTLKNIGSAISGNNNAYLGYMGRSGEWFYYATKIYDKDGNQIETNSYLKAANIKYGPDNSIFVNYENYQQYGWARADENGSYFPGGGLYYSGDNILVNPGSYNSSWSVYTFNIETGAYTQTHKSSSVGTSTNGYNTVPVFLDNGIKRIFTHSSGSDGKPQVWYLNDDGTIALKSWSRYEYTSLGVWYISITADKNFIIGAAGDGYLRLIKITKIEEDSTGIKYYQKKDLPEFLQPYFDKIYGKIVFNPYTGILSIASTDGSGRHLIARYTPEKGFEKLPIYLGNYNFNSGITLNDDLTKACFCIVDGTKLKTVDIKTYAGFSSLPYTAVNPDVITGKAKASAEIGAEVEVSTVLPNEVSVEVTAENDNVTLSME